MKWFFFFCLFLFIFPIVGRFFLKSLLWMLGVSVSKLAQKEFNNAQRNTQSRQKPEGVIDIDYIPVDKKNRKDTFKGGEYVDYEEVK
ncbi:MAG: DUF4834 family protein [Bacteroidota bacterium]